MLKFEKSKKSREISVRVRTREPLFNRTLVIAFSIAIGFHLFAALLFYVKPLLVDSEILLPASQVEIQFDNSPQLLASTSVDRSNESHVRYTIAAYSPSKPQIPSSPSTKPIIVPAMSFNNTQFHEIEFQYLPITNPTGTYQYPFVPLQIEVSGEARILQINTNNIAYLNLTSVNLSDTPPVIYQITFEIRVMNHSGKIYYDNMIQSSGNQIFDQRARQLLHQLSFAPLHGGYDTKGEITFIMTNGTPHVF